MINELEKKLTFSAMSDLERNKYFVEMTRYRTNKLAYILGIIGVFLNLFAAFICLNSMNPNSALVIVKIILNVFILLFGFLCCEQAKTYQVRGSMCLIILGVITLARILWIPLQLITKYQAWVRAVNTNDVDKAAELAEKYLGTTITDPSQVAWLPRSGEVRGIIAIAILAVAGILMIIGGIFGFIKAKKLAAYLNSLKETK